MKNLIKKLLYGILPFLALHYHLNYSSSIHNADAYYGNWKSKTETCRVTKVTFVNVNQFERHTVVETYEGSRRSCVDGSGLCFWGSSCS